MFDGPSCRPTHLVLLAFTAALSACDVFAPGLPAEENGLDGPIEGMTASQNRQHLVGDEEFGRRFAVADGLGPIFVASSCEQCHAGDGKGHPVFNLTRFGAQGPTGFRSLAALGGPQLQHRSIPGYPAEVVPPQATGISVFTAPAVTGLGYLDAVEDAVLIAMADPLDANGDGISGRLQLHEPNDFLAEVVALEAQARPSALSHGTLVDGMYIGRFGKKALTVNLLHQTVGAYQQDMGITTDLLSEDIFNPLAGNRASDDAPDPEASSSTVANVVFYLKTLRVPPRRSLGDSDVLGGEKTFRDIGCALCHVPTLRTGRSELAVLNQVDFHPYTDLLLHDMGPELDDGYTEGRALTSEWRTPPLWGIGIQENFQGGQAFYLHDGRAKTFEQAIEFHGGEGSRARAAFRGLSETQRLQLIAFLRSL